MLIQSRKIIEIIMIKLQIEIQEFKNKVKSISKRIILKNNL